MSWIKLLILALLIVGLSSGCSHRFKKRAYFEKHKNNAEINHFNPKYADKSKKVRLDDEGILTGTEPKAVSNTISKETKKHPTMCAYTVNGVRYCPSTVTVGETFQGYASWYGPDFNGKLTSNGEHYDMYAFTAAHKTLPMHTIVRVTNLDNLKQVTVRINDRGPFVKERIIDLSKAAARTISMTAKGTAPVRLEILGFNDGQKKPKDTVETVTKDKAREYRVEEGNVYVQIGSFALLSGAETYHKRFESLGEQYKAIIKEHNGMHKVLITGFESDDEARNYIATHHGFDNAFIIRD